MCKIKLIPMLLAVLVVAILTACGGNREQTPETRLFHEQDAMPIGVAAGSQRQYILLDDGSLWMWGWHSDGSGSPQHLSYAPVPIFVKDGVAEIAIDGLNLIATLKNGEIAGMGGIPRWHPPEGELTVVWGGRMTSQNGSSTLMISNDGNIYAQGEFMVGHLQPATILRGNNEEFTAVMSDGVFVPFHQVLTLRDWSVISSSNEDLMALTYRHAHFSFYFNEDGTKELLLREPHPIYDNRHLISRVGESASWRFLYDGRLKIGNDYGYEIFDFHITRNASSHGPFDELRLINGDNYILFMRMACNC